MTMPTSARGLSPVVDGYLAELDEHLKGLPDDERAEILSSVEDHIVDELAGQTPPSPSRVREVLDALGPVDSITTAIDKPPTTGKTFDGWWSRVIGVLLGLIGVFLALAFPPIGLVVGVVTIVAGIFLLRQGDRQFGWIVVSLGIAALIVAAVILLTLVSVRSGPIGAAIG